MLADEGTIFLDEISTASPGMQVKLLRVLQDLEFEPVGGTKTFTIDTRVILATNDDLGRLVAEGRFRQDLFYRINVINVELPPLRERIADIPLLAEHFLRQVCEDSGKKVRGFTEEAMNALRAAAGRATSASCKTSSSGRCCWARTRMIGTGRPAAIAHRGRQRQSRRAGRRPDAQAGHRSPERQIIREVLEANNWNRNLTAETLGINRTTLYKKMKRLGLEEHGDGHGAVEVISPSDFQILWRL